MSDSTQHWTGRVADLVANTIGRNASANPAQLDPKTTDFIARFQREQAEREGSTYVEWSEMVDILSSRVPRFEAGTRNEIWIALVQLNFPPAQAGRYRGRQNGRDVFEPERWMRSEVRNWLQNFDRLRGVIAPSTERNISLQ
ncbi:MAG: hypothetical protein H0X67_02445 [Acidobacteria bacterium]|nr:hypothetical protein [Acidobacteriota bacterium]